MTEDTLLPFDLPAVKRKKEASGFKARTIHRLREVDPRIGGSRQDGEKPLDCGLLAVDETSMVDVLLKRALLAAVSDEAALPIGGDVNQLSSVGPRQVLVGQKKGVAIAVRNT